MNYWPLLGIAVVVVGFVLRLNPLAVVLVAGIVSGIAAGMSGSPVYVDGRLVGAVKTLAES